MPIERETIIERPAREETVVVGRGSPFGIIGAIVAALVVLLVVLWLVNGGMSGGGGGSVNVDLPEVTVTE